jgi:DNA helicase-2/ATP-dependent DNA helicase PcrA
MADDPQSILEGLNPSQRAAAMHERGPALVVAGAGSGKTATVVRRIGYLMEAHGVFPNEIFAVTFTNKAAAEMKERVVKLVGAQAEQIWVTTFHSAGVRILRAYGGFVGLQNGFVIYDDGDQLDIIKSALEAIPSAGEYNPRYLRGIIDRAKSNLWTPDDLAREGDDWMSGMPRDVAVEGYKRYQSAMRRVNAIDFGDLLTLSVQLFREHPQILEKVQDRAIYVHVDEYQDTNKAQYEMTRLLSEKYGNLLVVGDPDQCLPVGTRIKTPRGCKRIEEIVEGDTVIGTGASGKPLESRVTFVKRGHYAGDLFAATFTGGYTLRGTPHHLTLARMTMEPGKYFVYLMYREDRGYRIGLTKSVRSGDNRTDQFGFMVRMNQEHADKFWILSVCDSLEEATFQEAFFAAKYGLPTALFHGVGRKLKMTDAHLQRLFATLETKAAAERLMRDLELHPAFPHHRPQNGARRQSLNLVMFQDFRNGPVGYHRVQWCSSREDIAQKLRDAGLPVRGNGKGKVGYRIELSRKSYEEALEVAQRIAQIGGMEIQRRAQIGGVMYAFTPLSHLRAGMRVLVDQGGELVEAGFEGLTREAYDGPVFDLTVDPSHTYVAEGVLVHNSIYKFRGADIQNILDFQNDYPDAAVYRLEENYRSNARVLSVANKLIEQNAERLEKVLRAVKPEGEPVRFYRAPDARAEAEFVSSRIEHLYGMGVSYNRMAILYRTNAQSRLLEERFLRSQIPVRLIGGTSFYERQEIKDMLSYARIAVNTLDDLSLKRALKRPKRGVGDSSVEKLESWARANGVSLLTAFVQADEILERGGDKAAAFGKLLLELSEYASEHSAEEFFKLVIDVSGYREMLVAEMKTSKHEAEQRLENIAELVNAAADWDKENHGTIQEFLDDSALLSSVDDRRNQHNNKDTPTDAVTMMTMHNAKGLEFENIFVVGLEEGLLPHRSSIPEPGGIEEERRLLYVGITRAMERLWLTMAESRQVYGKTMPSEDSRFLKDIPADLLETVNLFNEPYGSRIDPGRVAPALMKQLEAAGGAVTAVKGGERVTHPKFGAGKVLATSGSGDRMEAMIAFENGVGTKKLLVKYANLTFAP